MDSTHTFRVFTDEHGGFGDLASVVIDEGRRISDTERLAITRKLATSETAFINSMANASISIMHYQGEISFAGTVTLAIAFLLSKLRGKPTVAMHGRDGGITTWQEGEITWARTDLSTMPSWHHKQLESVEAVEQLALNDTSTLEHTMVWAWIDETKGLIRARTFANDWDIPEAEGNGSGSMMLAATLNRKLEIKHGEGSVIFTKPAEHNQADIGGRIVEDNQDRRKS